MYKKKREKNIIQDISRLFKNISRLYINLHNHYLRVTVASDIFNSGFEEQDITGHISNYASVCKRPSSKMLDRVSDTLNDGEYTRVSLSGSALT